MELSRLSPSRDRSAPTSEVKLTFSQRAMSTSTNYVESDRDLPLLLSLSCSVLSVYCNSRAGLYQVWTDEYYTQPGCTGKDPSPALFGRRSTARRRLRFNRSRSNAAEHPIASSPPLPICLHQCCTLRLPVDRCAVRHRGCGIHFAARAPVATCKRRD